MKTISIDDATLDACVIEAQQDQVLLTRGGEPVALMMGLEAFDQEQLELSQSDAFWRLIAERRKRPTVLLSDVESELLGVGPEAPYAAGA